MQDFAKIARSFRKKKLGGDSPAFQNVDYQKKEIERILPHRSPFLLIDSIKSIDLKNKIIVGQRKIDEFDPVFKGHFPNYPIYPGVLLIEMIGQMGVCLYRFLANNTSILNPDTDSIAIKLIKIHHVLLQNEVLPGDEVTIICQELESDDYTAKGIGQIVKGEQICTVCIGEFYLG